MLFEITLTGTSAVKNIEKISAIFLFHLIVRGITEIKIKVFAVDGSNTGCVFGLFHAAFNFQ